MSEEASILENQPVSNHEAATIAISIAAVSVAIGFVSQILFFEHELGINALIFVAMFLAGLFGLLSVFRQTPPNLNWVFAVPLLIFGFFLSWHTNLETVFLNLLMVAGSGFLLSRFVTHQRLLGGDWRTVLVAGLEGTIAEWFLAPIEIMVGSSQWFQRSEMNSRQTAQLRAILRGLIITVPIVIVFGALLASADVVFGDILKDSVSWIDLDVSTLIARCVVLAIFAWLCVVAYKLALFGGFTKTTGQNFEVDVQRVFRLGMIEAGMVLGSVDILFLLFVAIQARYFFGGEANITETGYTYAEYARRGFFELLAVSIMTLGLVWGLDIFTHRKNTNHENIFRALTIGMILMTGVMLISAFQRLSLYEEAFGYTRLRVMSHSFTVWLAVLFIILVVDIWRQKTRWLWMGVVFVAMGYVLTLNLLNLDAFITKHNVERFNETGKIDINYLVDLSDDAIPALAPLLADEALSSGDKTILSRAMGWRLYELDRNREAKSFFDLNFGRENAWQALDEYRADLEPFYEEPPAWFTRY